MRTDYSFRRDHLLPFDLRAFSYPRAKQKNEIREFDTRLFFSQTKRREISVDSRHVRTVQLVTQPSIVVPNSDSRNDCQFL